jgi:LysR family transcriptional regulator, low CO2-responsive transcriptional regulator
MTPIRARAFFGAATEGSFSGGAAKRLNVSQPSVTTQVGSIERHKVELFHRTGRGVQLSRAGTALLPMVRRLFTSLD